MDPMFGPLAGARRDSGIAVRGPAALLAAALACAAPASTATAQGYGSPGVSNVGPPSDALFPDLAALQDRGWIVRGQATFILQGHPAFRSPYRGEGS